MQNDKPAKKSILIIEDCEVTTEGLCLLFKDTFKILPPRSKLSRICPKMPTQSISILGSPISRPYARNCSLPDEILYIYIT
jgi:hypothetical protein